MIQVPGRESDFQETRMVRRPTFAVDFSPFTIAPLQPSDEEQERRHEKQTTVVVRSGGITP